MSMLPLLAVKSQHYLRRETVLMSMRPSQVESKQRCLQRVAEPKMTVLLQIVRRKGKVLQLQSSKQAAMWSLLPLAHRA